MNRPCPDKGEMEKSGASAGTGPSGISLEGKVQLLAFCVFEVMVGIFWPSMMTMRAHYVPEDMRR